MNVETIQATPEPEETICKAARNDYRQRGLSEDSFAEIMEPVDGESIDEKKENLLRDLIRKQHYGPLEHVHASFNIEGMSRVVMAQATRHRHLSWDIQSQRYCDYSNSEFTVPEAYTDSEHFSRDDGKVDVSEDMQRGLESHFRESVKKQSRLYRKHVNHGIPKEAARYLLPNAMHVNAVMSGNLRALMHVVNMRRKADVQPETRRLVDQLEDEIKAWVPTVFGIFENRMPLKLGL